ncbi:TetR family transcriptional regulator [Frankia sp. R43]|nr:TetR family transcriptional regulator [Frankia sp. R43]
MPGVAEASGVGNRGRRSELRVAQRAFTRARFIDAAVVAFAEHGYVRTTIDEIVQRAGATKATFYLHFRGKADILVELNGRVLEAFDGIYVDLGDLTRAPTWEGIRAWLARAVERWERVRDYVAPLWEGAVVEPEIRALTEGDYDRQVEYLAAALAAARDDLTQADAEITAAILLMPLQHFFSKFIHGQQVDIDRVLDALASAWLAIILHGAPPRSRG